MDAPLFKWWHLGLALVEDKAKPKRKKGKKKHKRELAENNGAQQVGRRRRGGEGVKFACKQRTKGIQKERPSLQCERK